MRPDYELAVASIDLPTRSSAFEWEIKFYGLSASPAIERQKCTGSQAHAVHSCGFAPHNPNGAWLSTAKTCTRLVDLRKMTTR